MEWFNLFKSTITMFMKHASIDISPVVCRFLELGPEWTIVRSTVDTKLLRIDIYIVHSGKNLVCPETGVAGTLYDHREERTWRIAILDLIVGRFCLICVTSPLIY